MKIAPLLLTLIGCGALTLGQGFAAEMPGQSSIPKVQEKHKPGDRSDNPKHDSQSPVKKQPVDGKYLKPTNDGLHGKPKINGQHSKPADAGHVPKKFNQAGPANIQSKPTPASGLPQPGLTKTTAAPKNGLIMTKTGSQNAERAKLPVAGGTAPPTARVIHNHGANTAAIGGLAASNVKNSSAAITGSGIHRKF